MPFKNIEEYKVYQKKYQKEFYLKNKENIKERDRLYRLSNKDKIKEISRLYRLNNKDKIKKTKRLSSLKNPSLIKYHCAKRRAMKLRATPKFANLDKIKEIYKNCPKGYHVDHIVPLNNKNVCGLHVEWNLQYLTPSANISKSNKLIF
jgi:hypothetical protein